MKKQVSFVKTFQELIIAFMNSFVYYKWDIFLKKTTIYSGILEKIKVKGFENRKGRKEICRLFDAESTIYSKKMQ